MIITYHMDNAVENSHGRYGSVLFLKKINGYTKGTLSYSYIPR
jgi:hypothetical protein